MHADHVVDHLHDEDRLADAGPAEETRLGPPLQRREHVDHLDARPEDLGGRRSRRQRHRPLLEGPPLCRLEAAALVDGHAEDIEGSSEKLFSDGHLEHVPGIDDNRAAPEPLGRRQGNAADRLVAQVADHLQRELAVALCPELGADQRDAPAEPHVDHAAAHADHLACIHAVLSFNHLSCSRLMAIEIRERIVE